MTILRPGNFSNASEMFLELTDSAVAASKKILIAIFFVFVTSTTPLLASQGFKCINSDCIGIKLLGGNGSFPSKIEFANCYVKSMQCLKVQGDLGYPVEKMKAEYNVITAPFNEKYEKAIRNLKNIDFDVSTLSEVKERLRLCEDLKIKIFGKVDALFTGKSTDYERELKMLHEKMKERVSVLLLNRKNKIKRISSAP